MPGLSPSTHSAADVIRLLALEPLPEEGGWFRRTGEAATVTPNGRRAWSTALALFTPEGFSALHRLVSDEVWCHQAGDSLEMFSLKPDGQGELRLLGWNVTAGAVPQVAVPSHTWQGAQLGSDGRWALVTCLVVPGFEGRDFQLGDRADLQATFPRWAAEIGRFTRG